MWSTHDHLGTGSHSTSAHNVCSSLKMLHQGHGEMSIFPLNCSSIVTANCAWKSRFYSCYLSRVLETTKVHISPSSHPPICLLAASSDTVLNLIGLRWYAEDNILLIVPTKSASDPIGTRHNRHYYRWNYPPFKWTWSLSIWHYPRQCSLCYRCLCVDIFHVFLEAQPVTPRYFIALFDSIPIERL